LEIFVPKRSQKSDFAAIQRVIDLQQINTMKGIQFEQKTRF
jgi:hypothetical protein